MKKLFRFKINIIIVLGALASIFLRLTYADDLDEPAHFNLTSLNGSNGFVINGINLKDYSGFSVSGAGDVNGDGIDDFLIGASNANGLRGQSYLVFGGNHLWPLDFNLSNLNGINGFAINGINPGDLSGISVSGTGDVNGDGVDDISIGAPFANFTGQSYIVFGSKNPWPIEIQLSDLNGNNGFTIDGINSSNYRGTGLSVSRVGDVNDDGIADIIIGAYGADDTVGQSYIVFGSKLPWPPVIKLSSLNGQNGFAMISHYLDGSRRAVSGAGDVNNDGIVDILVGAFGINNDTGQTFVVFGSRDPWPAIVNLSNLNGGNGFAINGINPGEQSGYSVSGAGDINGDGIDDILIGAPNFNGLEGQSYVIFGSSLPWASVMNFSNLNGTNGFAIKGLGDSSGISVSGVGDINGDGIDDILIGAPEKFEIGQTQVVFGSRDSWPAVVDLSNGNSSNGFAINGINPNDQSGWAINGVGDVNGDGIADIIIGAWGANNFLGQSYLIFGFYGGSPSTGNIPLIVGLTSGLSGGFFILAALATRRYYNQRENYVEISQ